MTGGNDVWASGDAYEPYVGRWSRLVGREFVDWLALPHGMRWLDDYWSPFLGGEAPAPGYCMSLSEDRRAELRERIRADLPIGADGSIALIARAWAVRGTVR